MTADITAAVEREFPCTESSCQSRNGEAFAGAAHHARCPGRYREAATRACEAVAPRWVKVTERLPELFGRYLIYTEMTTMYVAEWHPQAGMWFGSGGHKITAWQPLPAAPGPGGVMETPNLDHVLSTLPHDSEIYTRARLEAEQLRRAATTPRVERPDADDKLRDCFMLIVRLARRLRKRGDSNSCDEAIEAIRRWGYVPNILRDTTPPEPTP